MKIINLPYASITYSAPIVHLIFKSDIELGFPEIKELVAYAEELSYKAEYFILADVRAGISATPAGRRYALESKNAPCHKGTAVLVNNSALMLATNFFMGFKEPEFPFKAFTDEQQALDWLLGLQNTTVQQ